MLPEASNTDQQRSVILNELVQSILRLPSPDYQRAVELAEISCSIRTTPNGLDTLLRAILAQTFRDPQVTSDQVAANYLKIDRREEELRQKCEGTDLGFYTARLVDRLEQEEYKRAKLENSKFGELNLSVPIQLCIEEYAKHKESIILNRKWELLLRTEVARDWPTLHREASEYLMSGTLNRANRSAATRIRLLTFDMSNIEQRKVAFAELEKIEPAVHLVDRTSKISA